MDHWYESSGFILYIELIALGSYKSVNIEPMNMFRVAVMKNASRVILVHNHPSGSLIPSEADKDITDRLIQVAHILNIELTDHLIITPKTYISFRSIKLMEELEQSLKYVRLTKWLNAFVNKKSKLRKKVSG
ncbi:JAB domain-containing protein [Gilliamella sp. BG7]|uniref:JAB domain-containing protein n=1 Tax=unclassified Gilliamella TaxID=2685620 RepID=UPI003986F169